MKRGESVFFFHLSSTGICFCSLTFYLRLPRYTSNAGCLSPPQRSTGHSDRISPWVSCDLQNLTSAAKDAGGSLGDHPCEFCTCIDDAKSDATQPTSSTEPTTTTCRPHARCPIAIARTFATRCRTSWTYASTRSKCTRCTYPTRHSTNRPTSHTIGNQPSSWRKGSQHSCSWEERKWQPPICWGPQGPIKSLCQKASADW